MKGFYVSSGVALLIVLCTDILVAGELLGSREDDLADIHILTDTLKGDGVLALFKVVGEGIVVICISD